MLKVSDAFNSAFAAPDRELRARVTIGKTVYDSDDLTSINYDSGAMTGEQFSIGSTYMNSAKITFSHLVEGLKQLDEVLVEFGVLKPDGAVEYVKMGTFIVDDKIQMDRNNNTTTIECMDRMTMLGGAYVSKLTYPARIKDVAVEIANMAGVKANETSFARLSENKINQPTGYTYRDAIGLIAQFQMGFALFDRDGLLDIRTLQDNSFKIDPNQYFLKGLVKNETFFKLNGISCTVVTTSKDENGNETSKTTVLQSGSSSGAQIKLANNVMTQDVLDRMYEALKFTNYYPFSLNWNGNPAVEAGDWLTVEDLQGNEFKVPNMSYTLTYNGGLTATSKADTSVSSPATYSYGGTISNIVNEIGGRESAEGNHIYEGTEDQEPTLSKEGDLWYKHVGPDTEERIYKDGKWEFLTSTKTANDAADAADKASKEAEEAKNQANKAVDGANDAVAKAGFANDTATQAKNDAAEACQQAKDAVTSAGTAITDAQTALTNSSSAQADSAQARKDSATAIKDAADSLTSAKDALNKVGSLTTSVTSQFTTVDNELKSKVNQMDYDNLKGTVTSQQTEINQNASGIKLKADTTALNELKGTVDKQGSEITLNTNSIKLKADQSSVDTLKGTVDKQGSAIDVNTKAIALKASQSTVDTLTGRVSTAEGKITVQADQISQTVSKTELTSKLNGYATQTWSEGKISAAKNEITASVETVKQTVDNWQVGGRNYLLNSKSFIITPPGTANWDWRINISNDFWSNPDRLKPNNIRVSFTLTAQKALTADFNSNLYFSAPPWWAKPISYPAGTTAPKKYELVFNITDPAFKTDNCFIRFQAKDTSANPFILENAKLEIGTTFTDWTPAPEDQATVDWTKGQLSVTNDNVSASVQKLHDAVTGEITTATTDMATKSWTQGKLDLTDSQITAQISDVKDGLINKYTELQQTLSGVQATANNAVTQGQLTLLSNQFTSTIAAVASGNLVADSGWTGAVAKTHTYYSGPNTLYGLVNATTRENYAMSPRFSLKPNTTYTLSIIGFAGSNVVSADVFVLARPKGSTKDYEHVYNLLPGKRFSPDAAERATSSFTTLNDGEAYIRIDNNGTNNGVAGTVYFTEVQLEEGSIATPYKLSVSAAQSQITQLQNDINLRVKTGDLINQINISTEGILIDGKKVHITGQTTIDNAVIKDAMIADIKADKITAGTLNAANVNVINLNANNITTGTIKGANLSLNLNTGEVVFQHGRIHSASNNIDINVDEGYLSTASSNTRVMLKDGQLQLVQPTIFDKSEDPYLEISNSIGGASFNGANIIARDYLVLANRANSDAFFDAPLDEPETFAGLAVGKTSAGRWKPTRIGGADRGIIMRGGTAYMIDSSFMYKESPEILVGTDGAGLKPSDRIYINGSYVHIPSAYWRTDSGSANLIVARDGALVRSTSASKYKTDIVRTNIPDYGEKLLELPTATWTDIAENKRYQENPTTQPKPTRNFGMIAEDLADAGLEMLVVRGTDGELEGINYDRIGPALIPVIAKLKNEVETLKQKIGGKPA